jgi:hypothetical protein
MPLSAAPASIPERSPTLEGKKLNSEFADSFFGFLIQPYGNMEKS